MANPCECATGLGSGEAPLTGPIGTMNPPGSTRLRYRIGVHGSFKEAMRVAGAEASGLARHTSRDDSSAAVAFMDTTALLLDILTFYSERILNEGYLATATERLSLLEMARSIGYELNPGVAASTHLAFDVQISPGMPDIVQIDPGVQVQSIALPGELPRVFETVESMPARPEWNAFKAKQTRPQVWQAGKAALTVSGAGLNFPLGSRLLVMFAPLSANDWEIVEIAGVTEDYERKVSTYALAKPMVGPKGAIAPGYPKIYRFSTEARAFGSNAPDWRSLPASAKREVLGLGENAPIPSNLRGEWPNFVIHLPLVFDSRFSAIQAKVTADYSYTKPFSFFYGVGGSSDSKFLLKPGDYFFYESYRSSTLSLDQEYKDVLAGSFVYLDDPAGTALLLVEGVETLSRSAFALSGKSTIITTDENQLAKFRNSVRSLTVLVGSRELPQAEEIDPTALAGTHVLVSSALPVLPAGRTISLEGTDSSTGTAVSALLTVKSMVPHATQDAWDIEFAQSLPGVVRVSAVFRGNLVFATEGQSRVQVLGHGDARKAWPEYQLAAAPLTYVSSATNPRGIASTLEVSVDGLKWTEVSDFFGTRPDDEIYTVRTNDAGSSFVRFGDGRTGSRLPSGMNNLKAKFRTGLGAGGNLPAGRLTNLMTRPLGLQGVSQPGPASGGADPELMEDARENASLTMKALGRLVSLSDYADFARAYAGVAKAHGAWGKFGRTQGVLLTVAGAEGAQIAADSDLGTKFAGAVESFRDAAVPVQIVNYSPVTFTLSVRLFFDPRYDGDAISEEARAALLERYSFRRMHLGEAVTASAIISQLQGIRGVVGVDLDYLHISTAPSTRESRLPAHSGHVDQTGAVFPAELLTLAPSNLTVNAAAIPA